MGMKTFKYCFVHYSSMLSKERLKQVLAEQRDSILKRDFGIERELLKEIESKIRLPHAVVITGIRRCGKSTLLRQIIKKFYADSEFYYISFEDERLLNFRAEDFNLIFEALIELFGEKKTFFIDEIQNVENFEAFVRRFCDNGFKFFVSGSNAKLLSRELGTKLTGRHTDITLNPFTFSEFLSLRGVKFEKNMLYKTIEKAKIKKYFDEYLAGGGMPEFLIYKDASSLAGVYEDIVIKDIAVRHNVGDVHRLRELYQYLITNFSNKFSYRSLNKIMGMGSVNTVKKYISYLEGAFFAKTVGKFDYSLKKQMINDKKIYISDNGFIKVISTRTTQDRGRLLENLVFNTLKISSNPFYYANKRECDFLLLKNNEIKSAMQVCWELNEENREKELEGLIGALKEFNLKEGTILTHDEEDELTAEGKKIKITPVYKWLLA